MKESNQKKIVVYVDNKKHKLCFKNKDDFEVVISDEIGIDAVIQNVTTNKETVVFYCQKSNRKITVKGDSKVITTNKLRDFLSPSGIRVNESYESLVVKYLEDQLNEKCDNDDIEYEHYDLGWEEGSYKNINSAVFYGADSINAQIDSSLVKNDERLIGSNGQKEEYKNLIITEVLHTPMQLPFVLAFTAPIVPLMVNKTNFKVLLTNFAGRSSQGKSTSLRLIASVWGKGVIGNSGKSIVKTFSATKNALEASLGGNNGLPAMFDDYEQASIGFAFQDFIYTLVEGTTKLRCGQSGNTVPTKNWSTFIGLTGETSIFERAGNNLGLKPRIVEFKDFGWTKSAKNAETINSVCTENYGFYGPEFVKALITRTTKKDLDSLYEKCKLEIENDLLDATKGITLPAELVPIKDRLMPKLAIILMTAKLVKELLDFDIDIDYIKETLVQNEKGRQETPSNTELAKDDIIQFYNIHYSSFTYYDKYTDTVKTAPQSNYGRIYHDRSNNTLLAMYPVYVDEILKKYNDRDVIFENWRTEGFLMCDTDKKRFQKKVVFHKGEKGAWGYCFNLDMIEDRNNPNIVNIPKMESDDKRDEYEEACGKARADKTADVNTNTTLEVRTSDRVSHPVSEEKMDEKKKAMAQKEDAQTPVFEMKIDDTEAINEIFAEGEND